MARAGMVTRTQDAGTGGYRRSRRRTGADTMTEQYDPRFGETGQTQEMVQQRQEAQQRFTPPATDPPATDPPSGPPSYIQEFQPSSFQYTGSGRPGFDYTGTGRPTFTWETARPEDFIYGVERPTDFTYEGQRPEDFTYGVERPEDFTFEGQRPEDFTFEGQRPEDFTYEAERPEYQSRYDERIQEMIEQILGRGDFSYDYKADPLYQQYAEAYTRQGQQAMQDTLAQVSARTGGLASSYAGTASQGAYNQYMQALNDKIPELQQLAYSMYRDKGKDMVEQLGLLESLEGQDYGRFRDLLGDWSQDRQLAYQQWLQSQQQYGEDRDFAYRQWLQQQQQYGEDRDFAYRQWLQGQDQWSEDRQLAYQQWLQQQQQFGEDRDFAYRQWLQGQDQWEGDRDFAYRQWLQQQQQWEGDRDFAWQQYRQQDQDWDTDREWQYRGYQDALDQYEQEYARQYGEWQDAERQRYQQYLAQLGGSGGGTPEQTQPAPEETGGGVVHGIRGTMGGTGERRRSIDTSLWQVMQAQGIGGYDDAYQFLRGQGYGDDNARRVALGYLAR